MNGLNGGGDADSIEIDEDSTRRKGHVWMKAQLTKAQLMKAQLVGSVVHRRRILTNKKKREASREHGKEIEMSVKMRGDRAREANIGEVARNVWKRF
jgi:hypothetical protein